MDFTESYPDSSSSVALATRSGDLDTLKRLVREGKTIENQDNRGWRPIHEAAYWGHVDCLKFLVELSDTHVNAYTFEGQTALWIAADTNSIEAAKILLEAGGLVNLPNNEDVTPLHCAASKGFKEMTELLITNGANVNLPDYGLYTPLHEAAIQGHYLVVEVLLQNEADMTTQDSHGRTPLFCGAQSHSCQVVSLLVNEETPPSLINLRAHDGATTVMLAAQSGCINCIQLLVDHGANPNLKANDGVMAVHLALVGDHKDALKYLLAMTDHTYIEQSCAINAHNHVSHRSVREPNWSQHNNMESVNIYALAVTYERWDLVRVLIEEGLNPEFFPCPLRINNPGGKALQKLGYGWLTPLSFVFSHSPFNDSSFEIVKLLVGSSCVRTIHPGFVPPVLALLALSNWDEDANRPLLLSALDFFIEVNDGLRVTPEELTVVMGMAINFSPDAFQRILHIGYAVDYSFVMKISEMMGMEEIQAGHETVLLSLQAAGFTVPLCFKKGNLQQKHQVNTLKQLSRKAIHSKLWNRRTSSLIALIPELSLPLPQSLIKYLCFDDVNF